MPKGNKPKPKQPSQPPEPPYEPLMLPPPREAQPQPAAEPQANQPEYTTKIIKSREEFDNSKGKEQTPEEAMKANPNFRNSRSYQVNCQRCVWAYELRRRGFNVEARPAPRGDTMCIANEYYSNSYKNVPNQRADGTRPIMDYTFSTHRKSGEDAQAAADRIKNEMLSKYPNGARGFITGHKGLRGHVMNWERKGDDIKVYDAQNNHERSLKYVTSTWNDYSTYRVDHIPTSDFNTDMVSKTVYVKQEKKQPKKKGR